MPFCLSQLIHFQSPQYDSKDFFDYFWRYDVYMKRYDEYFTQKNIVTAAHVIHLFPFSLKLITAFSGCQKQSACRPIIVKVSRVVLKCIEYIKINKVALMAFFI